MTANLLPLVDRFAGVTVLVLGDLMLDRYLWGTVSRISPEAPVPVLRVREEDARLGGAGSVIANLAALGAKVRPVSVIGADTPGDALAGLLEQLDCDMSGIVRSDEVQTTVKTRVIARVQHLLRIDRDAEPPGPGVQGQLREAALARLEGADVVLVSDYARGVLSDELCRELFRAARERGDARARESRVRDLGDGEDDEGGDGARDDAAIPRQARHLHR